MKHLQRYVTGPHFNQLQVERMKEVETLCAIPPCKDGTAKVISTRLNQPWPTLQRIEAIRRSNMVVAVLDWAMPSDHETRVIKNPYKIDVGDNLKGAQAMSPSLAIPHSMTMMDVGAAIALNKPVIAIKFDGKKTDNMTMFQHPLITVLQNKDDLYKAMA